MNVDIFNKIMGWDFVVIAAIFALGLVKPFVRRFYPASAGFIRRLAAPVIFSALAATCFAGVGLWAFICAVILCLPQIVVSRWKY
ncbi:MAG: hypothetical protein ACREFR_06400 [Limisphaerales bacterium]